MLKFMQPQSLALSAAIAHLFARTHANTAAANGASKRTAWYPAFADQATWSPIG